MYLNQRKCSKSNRTLNTDTIYTNEFVLHKEETAVMKRKLYVVLLAVLTASTFAACGQSFQAAVSTVYITEKGTVIGADIEDFNEKYYDEKELKNYITESVDSYVASNGDGSVELESFEINTSKKQGSIAKLYLNYASYIDYAQFNDVTLYAGSISQAKEHGYDFGQSFQKVEDDKLGGTVDVQEVTKEDSNVVVIGQEITVKVDGKIQYVSDGNVKLEGKDTVFVSFDEGHGEGQFAYIIYK